MERIKVKIIEYTDDSQPGWVRCIFYDVNEKEWSIIDKKYIVIRENLDINSNYPKMGFIAGQITNRRMDALGRKIATINLELPWSLSTENGTTLFTIFDHQIVSQ
ncbi:hypothetical protein [Flavobacterium sp. '19STA2R22 D10 B1']|uniref:hypothetical protein n=1 Tax=Flavobacterium aerium TaxID=3037261 RepID=UPI00278C0C63|nr:hypothetical protein [Flavobacterium sp. '19STA2R22 D10 B1']